MVIEGSSHSRILGQDWVEAMGEVRIAYKHGVGFKIDVASDEQRAFEAELGSGIGPRAPGLMDANAWGATPAEPYGTNEEPCESAIDNDIHVAPYDDETERGFVESGTHSATEHPSSPLPSSTSDEVTDYVRLRASKTRRFLRRR